MRRTATVLATTIVAASALAGCGGGNPYCEAVEKDQKTLETFGQKRTNAGYAGYAKVFDGVAKVAPKGVKKDWTALSDVTKGVIAAQKAVGLKLEDMSDKDKVKELKEDQLTKLNDAYEAFNATTDQRASVVKNVKQECKITLK
jgi:hypothetical protein